MSEGPFCSECGASISPTAKFCAECGTARNGGARPTTTEPEIDLPEPLATVARKLREMGWQERERGLRYITVVSGRSGREIKLIQGPTDRIEQEGKEFLDLAALLPKRRDLAPAQGSSLPAKRVVIIAVGLAALIMIGAIASASKNSSSVAAPSDPDKGWHDAGYLVNHASKAYLDAVKVQSQSDRTDALKNLRDYCGAASGLSAPTTAQGKTDLEYISKVCDATGFALR
jgi:zinc-ribbon domain